MDNTEKRPLKVFLCHASGDKPKVRELYAYLTAEGINAWLDQEKLLPGQDWRMEIPKAVREADVVIICLSKQSITKEGYVQKEIVFALDIAEEKPDGTIFLIPARLEECTVPTRLDRWQWVDLYAENGYVKLLRSLKIRANAVGATIEPDSYINASEETRQRIEQLYTEGLAAFYTEDWDKACQRFQHILSEAPNHKNATEKLAEAKRQRNLTNLYKKATDAVHAKNWEMAVQYLVELSQQSPTYKDAAQLLEKARKQNRLSELYAEAKTLHTAQKWEAVIKVFEQIARIESVVPDPDELLASAKKELQELQRLENLKAQYSQALYEMDEGNWHTAQNLLGAIHKEDSGFLETNILLKKVAQKIEDEAQKKKITDEINTLYEQAHGLLRSKKWRNALDKLAEIKKLDADFTDTENIEEKANKELAQEEQETERQNQLAALYAEAVKFLREEKYQEALDKWQEVRSVDSRYPDRQRVHRTAKKKLGKTDTHKEIIQPLSHAQPLEHGWFILLAAIGFGLAQLIQQNLGVPEELGWGLRGALQGVITAWILGRTEKEWKRKSLILFGTSWAIIYLVVLWTVKEQATLLIVSMAYSLAPAISTILSSLWGKHLRQWHTYVLIFIGWILARVIGESTAGYISYGSLFQWVISDFLAGGIGLWITIDLLNKKTIGENMDVRETSQRGSAKLLLWAFLGVLVVRAIWGAFEDWLHVWNVESPTTAQFISLFVLGGFYGLVVSLVLRKSISSWKRQNSLITVIGWGLGLGFAILAGQIGLEFMAVVMALSGISVAVAINRANPSMSPIKITLIFLGWALSWKYGNSLAGVLINTLGSAYLNCFSDALIVLFGLLATLGIYEYSSNRLVKITLLSIIGFAAGNWATSAVWDLLTLDPQIRTPLVMLIWGFIAGVVFEAPSRNLQKILIRGGTCALGIIIGYFAGYFLLSGFDVLPRLFWGIGVGIALSLSARRISTITLMAILGAAIFMMAASPISNTDTTTLWGDIVRGAWIGLVLGFGYAYTTQNLDSTEKSLI